jgi:16S rRNA (guanine966-N2)-methyltransferase
MIGGRWRGKLIRFPDGEGLRPTPDRIRETVFNWLQWPVRDASVLDLFAGSGAFGLEALSRGAAKAVFVDNNPNVIKQLTEHVREFEKQAGNKTQSMVVLDDVVHFLQTATPERFNIVFLDPPYHKELLGPVAATLEQQGWLQNDAYIYLEAESTLSELPLPPSWTLHRQKKSGQVGYHLAIRRAA